MTFNYVSHEKLQYTVNKLLARIAAINSSGSEPVQQNNNDKEDALTIETVSSGATLTAALGKYYRFDYSVETLTISLPSVSGVTKIKGLMLSFTTGSSPAITINANGGAMISYFSDYAIAANKSYELNCMWNGSKWIIAYGVVG